MHFRDFRLHLRDVGAGNGRYASRHSRVRVLRRKGADKQIYFGEVTQIFSLSGGRAVFDLIFQGGFDILHLQEVLLRDVRAEVLYGFAEERDEFGNGLLGIILLGRGCYGRCGDGCRAVFYVLVECFFEFRKDFVGAGRMHFHVDLIYDSVKMHNAEFHFFDDVGLVVGVLDDVMPGAIVYVFVNLEFGVVDAQRFGQVLSYVFQGGLLGFVALEGTGIVAKLAGICFVKSN